jgi:hypothetical protein
MRLLADWRSNLDGKKHQFALPARSWEGHLLLLVPDDARERYKRFRKLWGTRDFRKQRRCCVSAGLRLPAKDRQIIYRQLRWNSTIRELARSEYFGSGGRAEQWITARLHRTEVACNAQTGQRFVKLVGTILSEKKQIGGLTGSRRNVPQWLARLGQLRFVPKPPVPRQVSRAVVSLVVSMNKADPSLSLRDITRILRAKRYRVSTATVHRILRQPESYEKSDQAVAARALTEVRRRAAVAAQAQYRIGCP